MYIYKRKPNYYETDQMGIIHHSNYIRWFEEGRMAYLEDNGFPIYAFEKLGVQIPVLEVQSKYIKMVHLEDEVEVRLKVVLYNGSRLNIEYEIYNQDNELCNTGYSKHCFINEQGRAISVKKKFPNLNEIFLKDL